MRLALLDRGSTCEPMLRDCLKRSEYPVSHFAMLRSPEELHADFDVLHPDLLFVECTAHEVFGRGWVDELRQRDRSLPVLQLASDCSAKADRDDHHVIVLDDARRAGPAFRLARSIGEARRDLRLAREKLALAEQAAKVASWDWDIATGLPGWSNRNRAMFGLAEGDGSCDTFERWLTALHPDDRERAMAAIESALNTSDWLDEKLRLNGAPAGGAPKFQLVRTLGRVLRSRTGEAEAMVGVHHDLSADTEMHLVRQHSLELNDALDLAQAQFATLFEESTDCLAFFIPDAQGRLVYAALNSAGLAHVPGSWDETRGRAPEDVLDGDGGEVIQANIQRVFETGQPFRYEPTFEMVGQRVTFDALYSPVRSADGVVRGVMINARDVSEQRRMERSLRQSEKMQALGQLSSGVAHDFANLLASTGACFHLLGKMTGDDPRAKTVLDEGKDTLERGRALTQRLLSYARTGTATNRMARIDLCLEGVVPILRRTLGASIQIEMVNEAGEATVAADPREIELALINLAVNARDAMPDGGRLTLRSGWADLAENNSQLLAAGRYVLLSATDTGCGMSPEDLARATQPFFTTKPEGVGTGLGLSIVAKFAHDCGGELEIASTLGAGTAVMLYLPAAGANA